MSVSPWNLMPEVMILGCGAFGKWLGHESGALTNEISAFMWKRSQTVCRIITVAQRWTLIVWVFWWIYIVFLFGKHLEKS